MYRGWERCSIEGLGGKEEKGVKKVSNGERERQGEGGERQGEGRERQGEGREIGRREKDKKREKGG